MEPWSESKILRIASLILVLLGILFLLFKMSSYISILLVFLKAVLGPFIVALIISYLLNPIVNLLSQRSVPRSLAVILIYTLFLFSLVILIMNMVPLLETQLNELIEHLPEWNQHLKDLWIHYDHNTKDILPISIQAGVEKSLVILQQKVSHFVGNIMTGIGGTINQVFTALIVPFLAFYMMKDAEVLERTFLSVLPNKNRRKIVRLFRELDEALGNYVRGQLLVSFVIGLLAYLGYEAIGLPYALLFAGVVSIFNVIPYLGPIFGAIPAVLFALAISKEMVIEVIIVNAIIQMLEGNVISPQIVGRTLHIHPLVIILTLLVGGEMGGIFGLIVAVPIFVIGKVIIEHILQHYMFYKTE